jgi:hypothetical protein
VAYTVDWTPVTRIKGVLTLVGLAYFAGLSLYFLKKETAEWAQQKLGANDKWRDFRPKGGGYEVKLPGPATEVQPALPAWPVPALKLTCHKASLKGFNRTVLYTVGAGKDHDPEAADREWFAAVEQSLRGANAGREVTELDGPAGERLPCREWEVAGAETLLVRVYRADGRVYLLAAQGPDLEPDDADAERFFGSFAVVGAK